jgi:hypothetical protein
MAGTTETEQDTRVNLKGTPANPARSPKVLTSADKNSVGWKALNDSIILIGLAWAVVLLTYFSLRHWNV